MSDTTTATRIAMPKLGESVTEGTIAGWLKQVGDRVERYEPMVEVVTDKVNAEVPAPVSGIIVEILRAEGDVVPVGEAIALIDEGGSGATAPQASAPAVDRAAETVQENVGEAAATDAVEAAFESGGDEQMAREQRDELALLRIRSSPLVRRLAAEHGIDLGGVNGSGIGGRVTKSDIDAAIADQGDADGRPTARPQPAPEPSPQAQPVPVQPPMPAPQVAHVPGRVALMPGDEVVEASILRRQTAEGVTRSAYTAPHVTVWMEADMARIVRVREAHKDAFRAREGFSLTYLPFVTSIVIDALREFPQVNSAWDDGRIVLRKALNIGVAVALEDGLVVPVIRNADGLSLTGLARAANELVAKAREGRLQPDDVQGGTFTMNNPGTLGSLFSTPIIVQPQAGILSMEAVVKRPVVIDDAVAIRPMMNLSLSVDHRVLDGLSATRFLSRVKRGLEEFSEDVSL